MNRNKYFLTVVCWSLINITKNVHYYSHNDVSNEKYKRGNPIAPRMIISGVAWCKVTRSGSGEESESCAARSCCYCFIFVACQKRPWQLEANKFLHLASHRDRHYWGGSVRTIDLTLLQEAVQSGGENHWEKKDFSTPVREENPSCSGWRRTPRPRASQDFPARRTTWDDIWPICLPDT